MINIIELRKSNLRTPKSLNIKMMTSNSLKTYKSSRTSNSLSSLTLHAFLQKMLLPVKKKASFPKASLRTTEAKIKEWERAKNSIQPIKQCHCQPQVSGTHLQNTPTQRANSLSDTLNVQVFNSILLLDVGFSISPK